MIQHNIPMKNEAKPFQQKMSRVHPYLELEIPKELKKLLDAKIIFQVRHSTWLANLVEKENERNPEGIEKTLRCQDNFSRHSTWLANLIEKKNQRNPYVCQFSKFE